MKNLYQKLISLFFFSLLVYWVILHSKGLVNTNWNYLYSFLFSLIPLFGGLAGMVRSKIWGRLKSALGKSVFYFSLGLFLWGAGSMVWSYYNFVPRVAAPYPSLADIGFAPSIFFWVLGAAYLSIASGARFALRKSTTSKLLASLSVVVLSGLAYFLLVHIARGGTLVPQGETTLKIILDIAYPLGDFLALIMSVVIFGLSLKYFGGYYRNNIISILLGLGVMFLGDFIFSYTTTTGTFYVGDWGDLVLTIGLSLLTFGILGFVSRPESRKEAVQKAA